MASEMIDKILSIESDNKGKISAAAEKANEMISQANKKAEDNIKSAVESAKEKAKQIIAEAEKKGIEIAQSAEKTAYTTYDGSYKESEKYQKAVAAVKNKALAVK